MGSPSERPRTRRLVSFDYTAPTAYFVTIVTHQRRCTLGMIVDDAVALSATGRLAQQELTAVPRHRANVRLDEFIVMPDHVHILLWITANETPSPGSQERRFGDMVPGSLSAIVRGFKAASTRAARMQALHGDGPLWQRNFYERVVRIERELNAVRAYIIENPVRAARGEDDHRTWDSW